MNDHHSTYIESLIRRTESLLGGVRSHLSGDEEVQKIYTLDYLCASLVEQIRRMERLKLSDDKSGRLAAGFASLFKEKKFEIVKSAVRGAEPDLLLTMFRNALRSAGQMLEDRQNAEPEPELELEQEQELYDQLVDCLVKRDDLFLIGQFIRLHTADFTGDEEKVIRDLFSRFTGSLSAVDTAFKEQLELFALAEKFCREYTASNDLTDEQLYWWFYDPIRKAEEADVVSAMSLTVPSRSETLNDDVTEAAAAINANVRFRRMMIEEKNRMKEEQDETFSGSRRPQAEAVYESRSEYSAKPAARLIPGIYAFTVNSKTTRVDHCLLTGMIDAKPAPPGRPAEYLDPAALQVVSRIPAVAEAVHALQQKEFAVELALSPDGWCGASVGLPAYFEYLRLLQYLPVAKPIAAAGIIDAGGKVRRVEEIQQKVERAIVAGFEIIVIPKDNKRELHRALQRHKAVFFAGTLEEAVKLLKADNAG